MGTREARRGQEGGLRRTDRGDQKWTVVETVEPERDHEELGNFGGRTQTVDPCVGRGEADHPPGTHRGAQSREAGSRPGTGVPLLMRCRRILRTCEESVITAMIFMGLWHRRQHRGLSQVFDLLPP